MLDLIDSPYSPFQAAGANILLLAIERVKSTAVRQGKKARIMRTTVDHALIRGLVTAGPVIYRGSFLCLRSSVDRIRLLVETRVLLAVTVPPALPNFG